MENLDNPEEIKALDKNNYLASVEALAQQCEQAWQEASQVSLSTDYHLTERIVVNGMGGSSFGGLVTKAVFSDRLTVPLEVINSYTVPNYVNEKTLFIFASYSGTTEEILATVDEVLKRKAKVLAVTSGGKLEEILTNNQIPFYKINPQFNPSGQPRAGLGYSIFGLMGLLKQAGLLAVGEEEVRTVARTLTEGSQLLGMAAAEANNPAKQMARRLKGKVPVIVAAEFLAGSTHVFRNQLHETSKNFADYFLLSEMNHHLLEGLSHPASNPQTLAFLFINSGLYHHLIQKRLQITKEVLEQNKISTLECNCRAADKLSQAFEAIQFGSFVSFYLAMLNGVDPKLIPWVDYLKQKLA